MKNLRHALAFSVAVLLLAGCPRKGVEAPDHADAAPTAAAQDATPGSAEQALVDAGAPQAAATGEEDGGVAFEPTAGAPLRDAGSAVTPRAAVDAGVRAARNATADAGVRTDGGARVEASAATAGSGADAGAPSAREACVDRWLAAQKLDRYGSKKGTMYTGGTPLFDERTGEQKDRLEYIFARHPAAKQACPQ